MWATDNKGQDGLLGGDTPVQGNASGTYIPPKFIMVGDIKVELDKNGGIPYRDNDKPIHPYPREGYSVYMKPRGLRVTYYPAKPTVKVRTAEEEEAARSELQDILNSSGNTSPDPARLPYINRPGTPVPYQLGVRASPTPVVVERVGPSHSSSPQLKDDHIGTSASLGTRETPVNGSITPAGEPSSFFAESEDDLYRSTNGFACLREPLAKILEEEDDEDGGDKEGVLEEGDLLGRSSRPQASTSLLLIQPGEAASQNTSDDPLSSFGSLSLSPPPERPGSPVASQLDRLVGLPTSAFSNPTLKRSSSGYLGFSEDGTEILIPKDGSSAFFPQEGTGEDVHYSGENPDEETGSTKEDKY